MRVISAVLVAFLVLTSCDKAIKGNLIDNFNKPVENVDIKILNSAYNTKSNIDGKFKIDFSSGKFVVDFQKSSYILVQKELEITDQRNYPIGTINMYRVPETTGLFFKGDNDFIEIPQIELKYSEKTTHSMWAGYVSKVSFILPSDSVFTIIVDSLKIVDIYDKAPLNLALVKANGKKVALFNKAFMSSSSVECDHIKESKLYIGLSTNIRFFQPEFNVNYVYINYQDKGYDQQMGKKAYAFRFEKR